MEFIQVMGAYRRVELDNIIDVRCFRDPPFKPWQGVEEFFRLIVLVSAEIKK